MYYALIILLIIVALLLAVVVLLQAGQGGGLASLGGVTTDLVVGGRQAVTLLTKATWILGGAFLFLSLIISLISPSQSGAGSDVLQRIRQNQGVPDTTQALPLLTQPGESAGAARPVPTVPDTGKKPDSTRKPAQ
jgi:preprotein translocase subunit SecG